MKFWPFLAHWLREYIYIYVYIYIGIVRNQTLGKRSTKWLLGGGNVPLGGPSTVQLQTLDFLGFCWIVPLKGFVFLQNLAENAGFSNLQSLSKNAGFARMFCMVHLKMLAFPGFLFRFCQQNAGFSRIFCMVHLKMLDLITKRRVFCLKELKCWILVANSAGLHLIDFHHCLACLRERRAAWRSKGLVQIHNWNRLPPQPSLPDGAKGCLKERRTSPNSHWNRLPPQPSLPEGAKDCLKEWRTSPNSRIQIACRWWKENVARNNWSRNREENAIFLQKIASKRVKRSEKLVPHTVL